MQLILPALKKQVMEETELLQALQEAALLMLAVAVDVCLVLALAALAVLAVAVLEQLGVARNLVLLAQQIQVVVVEVVTMHRLLVLLVVLE
jgi:hypothetical protein